MGSVVDFIECPNCKTEESYAVDYYYKTGEEYGLCGECGYHESHHYKRDSEGKLLMVDPEKGYAFENLIAESIVIDKPYAAYYVEGEIGGQLGSLEKEEDYDKFCSEIVSLSNQPHEFIRATVSRFVDNEIRKEVVYEHENYAKIKSEQNS
jgi:hypothetical protein